MKILEVKYHEVPAKRDYAVFGSCTPEQAAEAYAKKFGHIPEVVWCVKMFPSGVANYCEVEG
jgi:hypothetical protein